MTGSTLSVGRVTAAPLCEKTGRPGRRRSVHNEVLYSSGWLAYQLFGLGRPEYRISAVYAEFKNVASPGDAVTLPSFGLGDDAQAYFSGLSGSRDFLRVRLAGDPSLGIGAGFEPYFQAGVTGNEAVFTAVTSGTAGVLGTPFDDAHNSTVYGVALVATPSWGDRSRDVVYSRAYFDAADQVLKEAGHQISLTWSQVFGRIGEG